MITLLKPSIKTYTHIIHVADCHIRLNKRHDEYREVFETFYKEIKQSPENTVVALVGDVFHSKSDLSPECIQMASDLFCGIATHRPLILTAGNHDATLSNKNRLDSLTPIIDALNHPNIFYLKTTGLYGFGNILFNNMGVFDDPDQYIRGNTIPEIYRNQYEHIIALFHGPVDKASLESGYSISNPAIMTPLFDHHDMALLGDIHAKQDMQPYLPDENKPCVHYVGSMIQQNHGEGLKNHGYSLWNLNNRMYEFHELKNSYGYFTVEVQKGLLVTNLKDIPKKVRLRVKCFESVASEIKKIVAMIKGVSEVVEITYLRMDQEQDKSNVIPLCKDIVLTDLTNIDYQNKLISEFLEKKCNLHDLNKINSILDINRKTNGLIKRDDFSRNLKWKPIRFEWDNMFTYGEGNVIDFTQMDGVYGVFGPNKAGKSSLLSSILFCLFDKFDRGFKGSHVLNVQKSSFRCKLEFEIAGVHYFIERKGTTTRSGNVKVDVTFWKEVDGVEEELHGTARRNTNDIIRDYVGTYEDFILTAASFQTAKNNSSFIDMGNTDRKDLLVQFIGLNIFDRLHEAAGERNKELTILLKTHKDKNYAYEIQQNRNSLEHAVTIFSEINREVDSLRKQISDVNEEILTETKKMIKLDENVPTNLVLLEDRRKKAETTLNQKRQLLDINRQKISEKDKIVLDIDNQIQQIENLNLVESHKKYKELNEEINKLKQSIDLKKVEVRGKLEKVDRLKNYEYDPNCKYCINNSFVKDANKAKSELMIDKQETDKIMKKMDILQEELSKVKWVEKSYETYTKLLTDRNKIKDEISILTRNVIIGTNELEKLDGSLKNIIQQIDLYNRNKISVEINEISNKKIEAFRSTLHKLDNLYHSQNRSLIDISSKITLFKNQIDELTKTLEEVTLMESELDQYQQYLAAVGRDGIPYQVICNTVPEIEKEVNSILSQVVDYTIQFETDGKNIVPYVVYDHGRWPIELTSGYERFVASVAIRVALTNISNLPKTTFLAIDEGFGTLDPDNLASMHTFFSVLKNNFDFILIISHLDALKDGVNKQIELTKEGIFSKVVFE